MPIADRREKRYLLLDTFYNVTVACIETLTRQFCRSRWLGLGWARLGGQVGCAALSTKNLSCFLYLPDLRYNAYIRYDIIIIIPSHYLFAIYLSRYFRKGIT